MNWTKSLPRSRFVYTPFGPNGGWSWGNHASVINGTTLINQHLRVFDRDYRATAIASDPEGYNRNLSWDQANRIGAITVPGTAGGVPTITIPGISNALSVNQAYGYDALDRLTQFNAGYPGATTSATGQGFLPTEAFTYDAIGNRLTRSATPPGGSPSTATYAYPNTSATAPASRNHTLASVAGAQTNAYTYDATGNTRTESAALGTSINPTTGTLLTQTYDAKNRLNKTQIGSTAAETVTYKINALGQRVQKTGAGIYVYSATTKLSNTTGLSAQAASIPFNARYVDDEQGRLLGEYSLEGKLIAETIWFDDLLVATIRPKGANNQIPLGIAGTGAATANNAGNNTAANPVNVDVYYLHPDHLGTPRAMTRSVAVSGATTGPNAVNKAVWRWESDPFGTSLNASAPNTNPQNVTGTASQISAASFRVNNRFPGQLADAESGKYYNYFRDYDPAIGRYTTSDPIGLMGGLFTMVYVGNSPLRNVDQTGLAPWLCFRSVENINVGIHSYFWDDKSNTCCARTPGKDPLKGCKEGGPSKDTCFKLSNNDEDSGKLFSCCSRRAREGTYIPGTNDCQDTTNDCMKQNNIVPPSNPGRMGKCPACWSK